MKYKCKFKITGQEKRFDGEIVFDPDRFVLEFSEIFDLNFDEEFDIRNNFNKLDEYQQIFDQGNRIEGFAIIRSDYTGKTIRRNFIIDDYYFSFNHNAHVGYYKVIFQSIFISKTSEFFVEDDSDISKSISNVSKITWIHGRTDLSNCFRHGTFDMAEDIIKKHSQEIFGASYLQSAYNISNDDLQFDDSIKEYTINNLGKLNVDPYKLKKSNSLDSNIELSLEFDDIMSVDRAFEKAKSIIYFFNFISNDLDFPSQFLCNTSSSQFEIKNNYNASSRFGKHYSFFHERDISKLGIIDKLIVRWLNDYGKFEKPFESYKNSCDFTNSNERRLTEILGALESLFDRIEGSKKKYTKMQWEHITESIEKAIPEEKDLLERIRTMNKYTLRDKIGIMSCCFAQLYEDKIYPQIEDTIAVRNWRTHIYKHKNDDIYQIDNNFVNFRVSKERRALDGKIRLLHDIFNVSLKKVYKLEKHG